MLSQMYVNKMNNVSMKRTDSATKQNWISFSRFDLAN